MTRKLAALLLLAALPTPSAHAVQDCFGPVWDAPASGYRILEAGGNLYSVGWPTAFGANRVARFDGSSWVLLPGEFSGFIETVAEFQGDVVVAGSMTHVDGQAISNVARFDGTQWQSIGEPLLGAGDTAVRALEVYADELVAGGDFYISNGVFVNYLARFDGSDWQPLGGGVVSPVSDLELLEGRLAVGGSFADVGGAGWSSVMAWDGAVYAPLGTTPIPAVHDLAVQGTSLLAATGSVHRFDGVDWATVGTPPAELDARSVVVEDSGEIFVHGEQLTGCFIGAIFGCVLRARYDGTAWTVLEADERGSTLELDSLASYGGAVWETGSHLGLVRFSDQLELRSYTPDEAAWYAPPVLGLELDCDDPELPMSVRIGDEPALDATYVGPSWEVALPVDWTSSTGGQTIRVEHAGAVIEILDGMAVLPTLRVNSVPAPFTPSFTFRMDTASFEGTGWVLLAAGLSATPLVVPPLFSPFALDPASTVEIGFNSLGVVEFDFAITQLIQPPGVPAGLVIPCQGVALELIDGSPHAAFTQVLEIVTH